MVSVNKKKKLKNAYVAGGCLKNRRGWRIKRLLFFTASERQGLKDKIERDDKE